MHVDGQWHTSTREEVLDELESQVSGLTQEDASERLRVFGTNELIVRRSSSKLTVLFDQFRSFMVIVLLIATLISGILGEVSDAVTIMIIVLANALLGFWQQMKAEKSLASLRELTAPGAHVLRDGQWLEVLASELVPGDVIAISAGDRVPADGRLIDVVTLETEESSLTGESLPVVKTIRPMAETDMSLGDRKNVIFMGTMVTRGRGEAVVVETGMTTEMGKIADMIQSSIDPMTPLEHRLDQLGQVLVYVSIAITLIVVIAGVIHGHALYEMFLAGVSLAVAAIPEGLPAIVTIALALGVQRMIKRQAIVRKLPSVETLGCATVICSDKTGTLTQNQMTVKEIYVDHRYVTVEGDGYEASGRLLDGKRVLTGTEPTVARLLEIGLLCNHARLNVEAGRTTVVGDPTEGALLTLARKVGAQTSALPVTEFAFESERKRMTVIVAREQGFEALVKGAPDLLLLRCTHILLDGQVQVLTEPHRVRLENAITDMARRALRTLGFAIRSIDQWSQNTDKIEQKLTFVGLVGMMDPPRKEVKQAIATCRTAGIRTVMITGDHRLTAEAIARNLGILLPHGRVLVGTDLDQMSDHMLEEQVNDVLVFARVSPLHKLRIVKALQSNGHVVAMTGDGVNDAPAIKAADIGIAMGKTGTDVAKDASSLILADDNFATIVSAIEEGRNIYANIRKFIRYLLSSNVGEIITMFLAMLMGLPLPLLPIQILWVNLVTDGMPAIALGVDTPEKDIMNRPPRSIREGVFAGGLGRKIVVRGLLIGLSTLAVFYVSLKWLSAPLIVAQTMAFATLVLAQLIYVFDCRSADHGIWQRNILGNVWLVGAVCSSIALLLVVIYIPSLQMVFHTVRLPLRDWGIVLLAAALPTLTGRPNRLHVRSRIKRVMAR